MKNNINKYIVFILIGLLILGILVYKDITKNNLNTVNQIKIIHSTVKAQPLQYTGSIILNKFNKKNIDEYQTAAGTYDIQTIASEVTSTMLTAFSNSSERTLPLVANWNVGIPEYSDGLDPLYLIDRFTYGEHLVPTWKLDPYYNDDIGLSYYKTSIKKAAKLGLPLVFILPSPESALTKDDVYFSMGKTQNPNVITVNGTVLPELSPFGPDNLWKEVGGQWSTTTLMAQLQEWYPNPPLVIFIDEDASKKLSWSKLATSSRYIEHYPTNTSNEFKRTLVNAKWLEKYRQLHEGFKKGFTQKAWKQNVKFLTRNQLASNMGVTSDWINSATTTNQYANIWPLTADGLTINFNLDGDKTDTTDAPHRLLNNLPFMLEEAKELNPNFTYQLNIDANQKIDDPQRYRGFTQFALWFLRPSIIRQTPNKTIKDEINPLFQQVVDSVELIHNSNVLADFWKNGKLISTGSSNYGQNIPTNYQNVPREFLLKTDATSLVWAFALKKDEAPNRQWLIYAQSSEGNLTDITVTIPNFGDILVNALKEGGFYILNESTSQKNSIVQIQTINLNQTNTNTTGTIETSDTKIPFIGPRPIEATNILLATKFASPDGNGNGTLENPYSIQDAFKSLVAGDILFLRGGIYSVPSTGFKIYGKVATANQPIIIESYPGELAIIDGKNRTPQDVINGTHPTGDGLKLSYGTEYVFLRKLEIKNMAKEGIYIGSSHNVVEGCNVHDNHRSGINIVDDTNAYTTPYVNGWNIIKDNIVHDNSDADIIGILGYKDGDNADGITINSGIKNQIYHNESYHNSDDGYDSWRSDGTIFEYNISHDNGLGNNGNGNGFKLGGTIPLGYDSGLFTIARHCISYNERAAGFVQSETNNIKILHNTSYNNPVGLIANKNAIIENNIVSKCPKIEFNPTAATRVNNSWQLTDKLEFLSEDPENSNFLIPNSDTLKQIGADAN